MRKSLQLIIALIILISLTALMSPALAATNGDFDCPYRGGDEPEVRDCLESGYCDGQAECSAGRVEAKAWCTPDQCAANGLGQRCGVCYTSPLRVLYLGNADGMPGECPEELGFRSDNTNDCYLEVSPNGGITPPLPAGRYYVYHSAGCWDFQELNLTEGCVLSGSLPCKIIGGPGLTCGAAPPTTTAQCWPKEWKCQNKNVNQPPVVCYSGTPAQTRSCTPAGNFSGLCPTNQDSGQKDGTGQSKTSRTYNSYDYDSGSILNIPPVVLKTTTPAPTPTITPTPLLSPTPKPTPTATPTPAILTPTITPTPTTITPTVSPPSSPIPTPSATLTPTPLPNCPDPSTKISVPNTTFRQSTVPNGCIKPVMIVMHWSGTWSSANATYNGLESRGLSCQLATDKNMQLQMLQYFTGKVQKGYCVAGKNESQEYYNNMALNNEINGTSFDDIINNPAHERYNELIAETNRALESTCWMLKQYNIPKTQIFGHYELTPGKSDPGASYLEYFIRRINNECRFSN